MIFQCFGFEISDTACLHAVCTTLRVIIIFVAAADVVMIIVCAILELMIF